VAPASSELIHSPATSSKTYQPRLLPLDNTTVSAIMAFVLINTPAIVPAPLLLLNLRHHHFAQVKLSQPYSIVLDNPLTRTIQQVALIP